MGWEGSLYIRLESSARFARASGPGLWWALPWALPWALGLPLGSGGALRGSGPAGPWALVGPCGDRALSGPLQICKNSYFQHPNTLSISK